LRSRSLSWLRRSFSCRCSSSRSLLASPVNQRNRALIAAPPRLRLHPTSCRVVWPRGGVPPLGMGLEQSANGWQAEEGTAGSPMRGGAAGGNS
jgi:hypothetical protein